jgi:hypothetical protein
MSGMPGSGLFLASRSTSYLKVKREHALNALKLKGLRPGRGYPLPDGTRNRLTEEDLAARRAIYEESRRLVQSRPVWTELPEGVTWA